MAFTLDYTRLPGTGASYRGAAGGEGLPIAQVIAETLALAVVALGER
jgi:hypothetical protein